MIKWMNICNSLAMQKCSTLLACRESRQSAVSANTGASQLPLHMLPDPTMLWEGGSGGHWAFMGPIPSVRPPSDNDVGPYWWYQRSSRNDRRCGREHHEDQQKGRPTRPSRMMLSTDAAQTAPDDSATAALEWLSPRKVAPPLQWRCRLGSRHTKEVGDNVAPPLSWRDPSITPRYPGVPDLIGITLRFKCQFALQNPNFTAHFAMR